MKQILFLNMDGVLTDWTEGVFHFVPFTVQVEQAALSLEKGQAPKNESDETAKLKQTISKAVDLEPLFHALLPVKKGARSLWSGLKNRFDEVRVIARINGLDTVNSNVRARIIRNKKMWFLKEIDPDFNPDHIVVNALPKTAYLSNPAHNVLIDAHAGDVNAWNRHLIRNANIFPNGGVGLLYAKAGQMLSELDARGFVKCSKRIQKNTPNFSFICPPSRQRTE